MKNVIVFLLVLFAAPAWCVADIQQNKDGNYVEFAYATMSDGVKIAVAVGYPKGFDLQDKAQKWPAILEMSGYPNASKPVYRGERYGGRYITVSASVRGTGASFGSFYDYSETIIRDGYEVIENWIVKQSWSNGKVGVNGHSWSGYIGFMIASSNPPHLDAVVVSGISDDNIRGTYRPGGIDNIGFNVMWQERASLPTGVFGSDQAAAQIRGLSETEIREIQKSRPSKVPAHEMLQKVTKEGSSRALRHFAKDIRVPILILHAYQDRQTGGMWLWEQIPDDTPKRLLMSNGDHSTPPTLTAQRRAWFNFWLLGERSDALKNIDDSDSRVQTVFEVVRGREKNEPMLSGDFPLPETIWKRYYLVSGGKLSATPPRNQDGAVATTDTYEVEVGVADDELDRVDYQLAFEKLTAICGPITATLWASSEATDTDFFVVVSDVGPDGRVHGLQRGLLRASYRALDESMSQYVDVQGKRVLIRPHHPFQNPHPLEPGKPYRLEIEVLPVGHVFRAGHKLLLSISQPPLDGTVIDVTKAQKYKYESNQPPGTVTIHRGANYPSSILLPVLPDLPPISGNPHDVGDHVGIYLQNKDPERKTR